MLNVNITAGIYSIDKVYGKTSGLTQSQLKDISRLYRRRMQPGELISNELVRALTSFSSKINRTISIIINRRGKVFKVVIGDANEVDFEKLLGRFREAKSRLRGFRLFHTHLKDAVLSKNDLTTLIQARLDLIGVIEVLNEGQAGKIQLAHIVPSNGRSEKKWELYSYNDAGRIDIELDPLISEIESKLQKSYTELGGDPCLPRRRAAG